MSEMHISERLMYLMRQHDEAKAAAERAPKEVRYAIELAAGQQMGAVRDAMASAWMTLDYLKRLADEATKAASESNQETKP